MNKNRFTFWLRLMASIGVLWLLLKSIDLGKMHDLMRVIQIPWLIMAFAIIIGLRLVMTLRWWVILRSQGVTVPMTELTKLTFISLSLGYLLPGGVGPDVIRGYQAGKRYGAYSDIAASIVIDRMIGIYTLFILALLGTLLTRDNSPQHDFIVPLVIIQMLFIIGWLACGILRPFISRINTLPQIDRWARIFSKVFFFFLTITDLSRLKNIFSKIFGLSIIVHIARSFLFYCLYRSLDTIPDMFHLITYIPLLFAIIVIPVSIGGLGIREGLLVFFFSPLGIAPEISVGVGLLSHLLQIAGALPGLGLLWIDRNVTESNPEIEQ